MVARNPKKRSAQGAQVSGQYSPIFLTYFVFKTANKKRKVAEPTQLSKTKAKGKERASDRPTIAIPNQGAEDDVELSDEDLDLLEEYGGAASFLRTLDQKGIARCVWTKFT